VEIEVFDLLDGTYTVRYVATAATTPYTISVTVNADSSNIKTSSLTVSSDVTSPAVSSFTWSTATWPSADPVKVVHILTSYTFTTHLKDAYSNPIKLKTNAEYKAAGDKVLTLLTEITGQGQTLYSTAAVPSPATGDFDTEFTIPTSSDRSKSLCGSYTLHQYLVESGGLSASYYPNKWFSPRAKPYLTRIDPVINFNWGAAEDIIPKIAREYVSVDWVGYLMPRQAGSHSFYVEADDGVRVTVDGQILIDRMTDVEADNTHRIEGSKALTLAAGSLVPIRVEYYQATGAALIALHWSIPGGSGFEVIASSDLYHKKYDTSITAAATILNAQHTPQAATSLAQEGAATYEANGLTISWLSPADTGCLPIEESIIQATTMTDAATIVEADWQTLTQVPYT
jgi:hypothetical protein